MSSSVWFWSRIYRTSRIKQEIGNSVILSAQQRMVFESGFTGFLGLTIISPVWGLRLLLNGAFISKLLAAALRSGEKDYKKQYSTNNPYFQTEDVFYNPRNPVNPDSKPNKQYPYTNKHHARTQVIIHNQWNPVNPLIHDAEKGIVGKYDIETCRGEDAKHRVSTGHRLT